MSVEQLEQSVINLSQEDRRRFADWFYQHEEEIFGAEFSEATRREVLRRAEELHVQPSLAQPVDDEYFQHIKRRVSDALAGEASAR
ncbi:MAG: hypothetical protein KIT22_04405 [Verrucomicrobiae bacterium]|nr:hypothetical protein [Verrucomicrobiae bacterium]